MSFQKSPVFILLLIAPFLNVSAVNKVVYGVDNRVEVLQFQHGLYRELARSVAGRIGPMNLKFREDAKVEIIGRTLSSRGVCSSEKFAEQIVATDCTGFLVGDDLLVTAGHCMKSHFECKSFSWVFDFLVSPDDEANVHIVSDRNVYGCSEILAQSFDRITKEDYALIKLDRPVDDRLPLKVRTSGKIEDNQDLLVIGHPSGLPMKIADDAYVRSNMNQFLFVANLDSFGGNSGSPVFNVDTGVVEGILVRGEDDYVYDFKRGCSVVNRCSGHGCRGEDVTRITRLVKLMELLGQ